MSLLDPFREAFSQRKKKADQRVDDTRFHEQVVEAVSQNRADWLEVLMQDVRFDPTRLRHQHANWPLWHEALIQASAECALLMVQSCPGIDVSSACGASSHTALHIIAFQDWQEDDTPYVSELLRLLIEKGAQVNKLNAIDQPPLHTAAAHGFLEMVQLLIDHGADLFHVEPNGKGVLDVCRLHTDVSGLIEQAQRKQRALDQAQQLQETTPSSLPSSRSMRL